MTRAGVSTVAMAAAAICAGTLGYAVIWSYGEPETLPVAISAAPEEQSPVAPAQDTPATPAPAAAAEAASAVIPDQARASSKQDVSVAHQSVPEPIARIIDAILAPTTRIEKPAAALARKDGQTAAAAAAPAASPSAAPAAPPPPESASAGAPSSRAVKPVDSPAGTSAPKELAADRPLPVSPGRPLATPFAAVSKWTTTETVASEKPAMLTTPPEATTAHAQPHQFRSITPAQIEGHRAPAVSPPVSPPPESPPAAAPLAPTASSLVPSSSLAFVPPTEGPEPALTSTKVLGPAAKPHRRMAALPPQTAFDHSSMIIIRGARTMAHRPSTSAHLRRAVEKQKLAVLPSGAAANADAPPILVLRGTHSRRHALASAPPSAPEPMLVVIRGARPRPVLLQHYVQPNALILHIHH